LGIRRGISLASLIRRTKASFAVQPVAGKSELGNGFSELNDPVDQDDALKSR